MPREGHIWAERALAGHVRVRLTMSDATRSLGFGGAGAVETCGWIPVSGCDTPVGVTESPGEASRDGSTAGTGPPTVRGRHENPSRKERREAHAASLIAPRGANGTQEESV